MTSRKKTAPRAVHSPFKRFLRRRAMDLTGLALVAVAGFVGMALATYDPIDPSFNRTGEGAIENAGGVIGAYIADMLMQTTGLASLLVVVACLTWGWRCLSKIAVRGWVVRICMLLLSLVTFSTFFALFKGWSDWPVTTGLGGAIGLIVKQQLGQFITNIGASLLMLALSLVTIPFALGLRRKEWFSLAILASQISSRIASVVRLIRDALRGSSESSRATVTSAPSTKRSKSKATIKDATKDVKLHVKKISSAVIESRMPELTKDEDRQATLDLSTPEGLFELPSTGLMNKAPSKAKKKVLSETALKQNAEMLEATLRDFGVNGDITRVRPGPVVTLYELEPAAGTKSSRVIGLADDIARSMSAISSRIAVIPGKNALGIEMPNATRETVYIREMCEHESYKNTDAKLPLILGKDIGGDPIIADLARMPHLLVAGTTGSGKSVAINTMITSLVYHLTPEQCKFIMIDPKMLELSVYDGIPHLLSPVVTEPGKAVVALKWTVKEMENRYRLMSNLGVRNIDNYNKRIKEAAKKGDELFRTVQTGFDPDTGKPVMEKQALDMNPLPYIVVVVDEMADLMLVAGKDIESSIQRLAQMARAAGIHIIMATQRPSVDVITGVIKANFPTRISFSVTSKIDSRTILGEQGAEQLLGQGDMLYMAGGGRIQRVHGPFISDKEVELIVDFLKNQGEPEYVDDVTKEDENFDVALGSGDENDADRQLFDEAVQIVLRDQKASTSYIQRKLKIGYNRAARIIEQMEEEGIVGAANHVGKREVLHRIAS